MKKLALILAVVLLLAFLLTACGGKDPVTAEEVLPVARALIEKSVIVNTIMIGDGFPTGSEAFGEFLYGDRAFEEEHNLHSVEDILTLTASVYSTQIYTVLYDGVITKDGVLPPDYQNRAVTDTNPTGGVLVHRDREGWYKDTTHEYLFDTMTMTAASANAATVTITVRIQPAGYEPQEREISVNLIRNENGWRLDKLTYVAYDYSLVNQ